jgi:hypothetical protein
MVGLYSQAEERLSLVFYPKDGIRLFLGILISTTRIHGVTAQKPTI